MKSLKCEKEPGNVQILDSRTKLETLRKEWKSGDKSEISDWENL